MPAYAFDEYRKSAPSVDAAKRWYHSDECQPLVAIRLKASKGSLMLVEGV